MSQKAMRSEFKGSDVGWGYPSHLSSISSDIRKREMAQSSLISAIMSELALEEDKILVQTLKIKFWSTFLFEKGKILVTILFIF